MTVIDLQFRRACKDVEDACAEIVEIARRSVARVKAEEIASFERSVIARTKAAIEDEEWRRPSDCEGGP